MSIKQKLLLTYIILQMGLLSQLVIDKEWNSVIGALYSSKLVELICLIIMTEVAAITTILWGKIKNEEIKMTLLSFSITAFLFYIFSKMFLLGLITGIITGAFVFFFVYASRIIFGKTEKDIM